MGILTVAFPDSCDTPLYGVTEAAGEDPSILARPAVNLRNAGNSWGTLAYLSISRKSLTIRGSECNHLVYTSLAPRECHVIVEWANPGVSMSRRLLALTCLIFY